jgi:hypothetical protein
VSPRGNAPLASPTHTVVLLLILSGVAVLTYFSMERMRVAEHPHRVRLYVATIVWEWLLMAYVLVGVRRHHAPIEELTGARWKGPKDFFRDIGIALGFWFTVLIALGLLGHVLHFQANFRYLAPESALEVVLWIAVSLTAGICEERFSAVTCRSNSQPGPATKLPACSSPPLPSGRATPIREQKPPYCSARLD